MMEILKGYYEEILDRMSKIDADSEEWDFLWDACSPLEEVLRRCGESAYIERMWEKYN